MGKFKILIADDDREFRETLSAIFTEEGFRTIEASDGQEAVKAFEKNIPDLVILDLNMPVMNGAEAAKRFKAMNSAVPIVIISGEADMLKDIDAATFGAYYYASKPPDFDRLIEVVNAALGRFPKRPR